MPDSHCVDVHAHFNDPRYFSALQETGAVDELSVFKIVGHLWLGKSATARMAGTDDAMQVRIGQMDKAGIDRQIISLGSVHPYLRDVNAAGELASLANECFAQAVDSAAGRLKAYAALPLPHVEASLQELKRIGTDDRFVGYGLGCSAGGLPLDDERFEPLWEEIDAQGRVVYLHPGHQIDGVVGCLDYHLAPDFVSPAEVAVTVCRLLVRGVVQRHPDITWIAATLGGGIPFLANRFDRGLRQDNLADYERLGGFKQMLREFYYDTSVVEEPLAIMSSVDAFGGDRLLLGTDFSRPDANCVDGVDFVTSSNFLTEDEKQMTLRGNPASIFGQL